MTTTRWIRITPGPMVETPRVVALIELLAHAARVAGRSLWRALEARGQRQATAEFLRQAAICRHSDPARAELLREAARLEPTGRDTEQVRL